MAETSKKRPWRRDRPVANPYRDTLSQEIGYKVDTRTAGCLLTALAVGLLALAVVAFIGYWLTH
jgi:hypothetical protein